VNQPAEPDIFTIEVVKSGLVAIGDEMFLAQRRSSMSPIIYEALDFGIGLTDARGRLIAQGNGIPGFIGTLDAAVVDILNKFGGKGDIHPGDIFVTNDPYGGGGTHLSDVTLAKPVFHEGELVAWTANKAHWTEVGGKDPGSFSPDSTEIYQEGLQFPTIKIFERDKPIASVIDIIEANVRLPEMTLGDVWSGVASLKVGESRFLEIVERYGRSMIDRTIEALLDHSDRMVQEAFKTLPRGTFEAVDVVDEDGLGNGPFYIKVRVDITDDEFIVDYTGSSPQAPGPVNNTYCGLISAARQAFISIAQPDAAVTEGSFRRLRIICPEGTIVRAVRPAPVSSYYEAMIAATDVIWKALAVELPDRLPAGQFGSICSTVISGNHAQSGEPYILVEPLVGGWGAGQDKDGENGQFCVGNGETANIPVEIAEARYGVHVDQYAFNTDTAGAGQFRGGRGVIRDYRIVEGPAYLSTMFGRSQTPPWPINGGESGSCNYAYVIRADGTEEAPFSKIGRVRLDKGDVARLVTGSGAGWGSPHDRDPESVRADIRDGLITAAQAQLDYA
jgi:N-methylhydantoinase B